MASLRIECLGCGDVRVLHPVSHHRLDGGECPRCGYVGWAASSTVDERLRRVLRERPLVARRVRLVG
jgi:uncharacterized Zn finger protein